MVLEIWKCCWSLLPMLTLLFFLPPPGASQDRIFNMDRLATCGQDITVFENEVVLNGRSNAAPPNPPLECTVYLKSGYTESDGRYRLQIIIEAIDIKDCQVHVDVFNGRGAFGSYLRSLGCNSMSTDTLYSENRQATVRFTRPSTLYETAYTFTFKIRTYRDIDGGGYDNTTIRLSPGAIIGIIVGIVALFVVAVLILWCYRTGRIGGFYSAGYGEDNYPVEKSASFAEINDGLNLAKSESLGSAIDYRDPQVWSSVTNGLYHPEQPLKLGRNFQKRSDNMYRNVSENESGKETYKRQSNFFNGRAVDSAYEDSYEPYESGKNVQLSLNRSGHVAEWNKDSLYEKESFNRSCETRESRGSQGITETGESPSIKRASITDRKDQPNKSPYNTLTKHESTGSKLTSPDRDSATKRDLKTDPSESETIQDMSKENKCVLSFNSPRESQMEQMKVSHSLSDDQPSENRNTKASLTNQSDTKPEQNSDENNFKVSSLKEIKKSPSSAGKKKKREISGIVDKELPPEANDPIFTVPVSDTPYDPSASLPYTSFGVPSYDAMYPYGMPQVGGYTPLPGQTYAYYQMGPMPGTNPNDMGIDQQPALAGQAAWFVQDTPQGPVQKAFMVTARPTNRNNPGGKLSEEKGYGPPGTPGHSSTPAYTLKPQQQHKKTLKGDPMDISMIAPGGPPPEPEAGQRSSVMRKGVDPNTGMHVNQIVWRDTIVDPSDPPPDANPQITRKTLTRITTHSGHGDLPCDQNPVAYNDYSDRLGIESESPDFLSPLHPGRQAAPPALSYTPDRGNQAFYTGRTPDPDLHTYNPEPVIHNATSRNNAFRDKITMGHSEA